MAATLYLIRHGETRDAHERRYKGRIDVPLSAGGEEQLRRTARRLARVSLDAVYSSTLSRARRSAEILSGPHGLEPQPVPEFVERDFGRWEGLTFDECRELHPGEFEAWARDPLSFRPVGGESTLEVRERVMPAFERILARHEGGAFAVVAHGGINRILLCEALGMPLSNLFRVEQDFAAVNVIEYWKDGPVVRLVNGVFWR